MAESDISPEQVSGSEIVADGHALKAAVEAIVYVADQPVTVEQIIAALEGPGVTRSRKLFFHCSKNIRQPTEALRFARSRAATRCLPSRSITIWCAVL